MGSDCYAMVRGSALRVTELTDAGRVPETFKMAVSKAVARVRVNEVTTSVGNDILKTPDEERRLRFDGSTQTIRYTCDIDFLRVDPQVLSLIAGVQVVTRELSGASGGFGEGPFGYIPYGDGASGGVSRIVGFDAGTRLPVTSFALEVWSRLAGQACDTGESDGFGEGGFGEGGFGEGEGSGERQYGWTLFPHLRGGRVTGFQFAGGLVSFNIVGAQTRRVSGWGVGPYDMDGPFERLTSVVSGNTPFRTMRTTAAPPEPGCGTIEVADAVLDNGDAANPMPDPSAPLFVDGGGAVTSAYIIDGGRA